MFVLLKYVVQAKLTFSRLASLNSLNVEESCSLQTFPEETTLGVNITRERRSGLCSTILSINKYDNTKVDMYEKPIVDTLIFVSWFYLRCSDTTLTMTDFFHMCGNKCGNGSQNAHNKSKLKPHQKPND